MIEAISRAVSGVSAGVERLDKAAANIAHDGAGGDLSGDLVDLMHAGHEVRANAAVIRAADATIGSLLDVWA